MSFRPSMTKQERDLLKKVMDYAYTTALNASTYSSADSVFAKDVGVRSLSDLRSKLFSEVVKPCKKQSQ